MKPIAAAQATVAVATALLTIYRCLEQGKYSSRDVFEPSILDRSETLQQFDILCAIVCLFMPAAVAMQEALKAKFNMLRTLLASILVLPSAIVLTLLLAIAVGAPMSDLSLTGTCHVAALFGATCLYPWMLTAGFNGHLWHQLVHSNLKAKGHSELAYPLYCATAGTLLGALPLPLDWRQPWQTYPAPVHLGFAISLLIGVLLKARA
eukprot:TRINITY_DN7018_c0_g1_i4.p1 TRINITY_DN7018_c0_g1~~TRINITY_DN7018_c0_g1_i4.p1  ORF type:complete len:207 (+),score=25.28 TRINITY_DN7018_c0_g1_i4:67-687(+)